MIKITAVFLLFTSIIFDPPHLNALATGPSLATPQGVFRQIIPTLQMGWRALSDHLGSPRTSLETLFQTGGRSFGDGTALPEIPEGMDITVEYSFQQNGMSHGQVEQIFLRPDTVRGKPEPDHRTLQINLYGHRYMHQIPKGEILMDVFATQRQGEVPTKISAVLTTLARSKLTPFYRGNSPKNNYLDGAPVISAENRFEPGNIAFIDSLAAIVESSLRNAVWELSVRGLYEYETPSHPLLVWHRDRRGSSSGGGNLSAVDTPFAISFSVYRALSVLAGRPSVH